MQFLVGILRKFKLVFDKLENFEMGERVGNVIRRYLTRDEENCGALSLGITIQNNRKEVIN
jgi:hypothetical protein